jgi:hypothetical protein
MKNVDKEERTRQLAEEIAEQKYGTELDKLDEDSQYLIYQEAEEELREKEIETAELFKEFLNENKFVDDEDDE